MYAKEGRMVAVVEKRLRGLKLRSWRTVYGSVRVPNLALLMGRCLLQRFFCECRVRRELTQDQVPSLRKRAF